MLLKKIGLIVTTLLLSVGFVSIGNVNTTKAATIPQLSKQSISQLKRNFSDLNISNKVQDKLLEKIKKGELIDSMNPKKLEAVSNLITPTLDQPYKTYTFEDGSKITSGITVLDEEKVEPKEDTNLIQPLGSGTVDVTHQASGTGYTNITAYVWYSDAMFNASFHAKFTLVNGGYDYISSVYDPNVTTFGYTWSQSHFGIDKSHENSTGRAKASLRGQLYLFGTGVYSTTAYLNLYVGKNSYSSTSGY